MDVEQIRSVSLFAGLTDDELAPCAEALSECEILAGSSLAKQDDFAYKFFIVLEGEVDVHRDFELINQLGPGDIFGETALVKGEKRNARVTARTRCRLGCMMTWDFTAMTERLPIVAERVAAVIDARQS